jgi:hypothetical protein
MGLRLFVETPNICALWLLIIQRSLRAPKKKESAAPERLLV